MKIAGQTIAQNTCSGKHLERSRHQGEQIYSCKKQCHGQVTEKSCINGMANLNTIVHSNKAQGQQRPFNDFQSYHGALFRKMKAVWPMIACFIALKDGMFVTIFLISINVLFYSSTSKQLPRSLVEIFFYQFPWFSHHFRKNDAKMMWKNATPKYWLTLRGWSHFDHQTGCAAPGCQSKYTTPIYPTKITIQAAHNNTTTAYNKYYM